MTSPGSEARPAHWTGNPPLADIVSGMAPSPDYILEIDGVEVAGPEGRSVHIAPSMQGRPWLAVHWQCCNTYSRIYRNAPGTAYHGWCPKCGKPAHARVGPGGTRQRFFKAH